MRMLTLKVWLRVMCDRCAELERENQELRRALDGAIYLDANAALKLHRKLDVTRQGAEILWALYQSKDGLQTRELDAVIPISARYNVSRRADPEYCCVNAIRVCIMWMRRRLPPGIILSKQGVGYWLSDKGRDLVQAVLDAT